MYLNNLLSANFDLGIMPNPDRERTEQNEFHEKPSHIEFHNDSERILRSSLRSVDPEEGCALLIGNSIKLENESMPNVFHIQLIWPCCNVWTNKIPHHVSKNSLNENTHKELISRKNRFALDPKEQLLAQKWARTKDLKILGTAHSHPQSKPIPSKIDIKNCFWLNLMIIINGYNDMRAWWINQENFVHPLELPFGSINKNNIIEL